MAYPRKKGGHTDIREMRQERRKHILMVLRSRNEPTSSAELANDALLKGMKPRMIGQTLRFLHRDRKVKYVGDKKFIAAPVSAYNGPVARRAPEVAGTTVDFGKNLTAGATFVLHTETQKLELEIGGMRLPVRFER